MTRSPHGRVDDNDEGNGDGEREQRDESQLGRNVRRRSKSDEDGYAACAQIYCRRVPFVYARRTCEYQRNSYFQGNVRRSSDLEYVRSRNF